jgi:hypothetical protein
MTKDITAQLAILADALTQIVDLTAARATSGASSDELLKRAVDIAAGALAAAATMGNCARSWTTLPFKVTRKASTGRS